MKIEAIRCYCKTLLMAIMGRNPYLLELQEVRREYAATAHQVAILDELHNIYKEKDKETARNVSHLQGLVEVLRERIDDKNEQIRQMEQEYRRQVENYEKRVGDYCLTIAELQARVSAMQNHAQDDE